MKSPKRSRLPIVALAAFSILVAGLVGKANALQGTPVSESATPDASPVASPATDTNQSSFGDMFRYFSDLGYGDQTVTSGQGLVEYFLPMPPGVVPVDYSGLVLNISHSPLLRPDLSTMTVSANGVAITSVYLDETNQSGSSLEIQLPVSSFSGAGYLIDIRFTLRLSDESCEPADNQALWATVHADSTFYFSMSHTNGNADLATLDRQFVNLVDPVTIVLPENPSSTELDAAGKVAFELGRWNGDSTNPPAIAYATIGTPISGPAILIGAGPSLNDRRDWNGLTWNGTDYQSADTALPSNYGVIALLQDPKPILLVSGGTDDALAKAVNALIDPNTVRLLDGPFAIVTGQEPVAPVRPVAWTGTTTTFAQLGLAGREIRGEGSHTVTFTTSRPASWTAGNGGNLILNLQSSPAVLPEFSWISVVVNGVQIGSASIISSTEPTAYSFPLPAEAVNVSLEGTLQVEMRIHLQLATEPCQSSDPSSAWIVVLDDSSWTIPHNTYTGLDLARLPAPFASASNETPFLIAVPDAPTAEDIDAALHIASAFGQRTGPLQTGVPQVIRAGEVTEEQRASNSIVILGGPDTNSLASSLDTENALPAIVSQSDVSSVVRLSMVPSPWFSGGAVLSIVPDATVGASSVATLFGDAPTLAALSGTSAIVDPNLLPETTSLAEVAIQPPDSTPIAEEAGPQVTSPPPTPTAESAIVPSSQLDERQTDDSEIEGWLVAGSILLGGFVVAIGTFLWVRYGRKQGSED